MSARKINHKIDEISLDYMELIKKAKTSEEKRKLFEIYYGDYNHISILFLYFKKKAINIIFSLIIFLFSLNTLSFAEDFVSQKPFVKQHIEHEHKIDINNSLIFQAIDKENYSTLLDIVKLFMNFKSDNTGKIFLSISFSIGNGINPKLERQEFSQQGYGGNTQSYLENINDTGRKYILEAWYHKDLEKFYFVIGIIDSAAFIDENLFANDELLQFMNSTFVNNPISPLPAYNPGTMLGLKMSKNKKFKMLYMDNSPNKGQFLAFEYIHRRNSLNIRPYFYTTVSTTIEKKKEGLAISTDYKIKSIGLFARVGRSTNSKNKFITTGLELEDFILKDSFLAIGYGYIYQNINQVIIEAYYKKELSQYFSFTVDIQYINEQTDIWIYGSRLNFIF